jgi:GntR family transcriptional regulator
MDPVRAERDLATHYGVAYGTIRRAMQLLRERGLIETIHGRGTFVARSRAGSAPEPRGYRTETAPDTPRRPR